MKMAIDSVWPSYDFAVLDKGNFAWIPPWAGGRDGLIPSDCWTVPFILRHVDGSKRYVPESMDMYRALCLAKILAWIGGQRHGLRSSIEHRIYWRGWENAKFLFARYKASLPPGIFLKLYIATLIKVPAMLVSLTLGLTTGERRARKRERRRNKGLQRVEMGNLLISSFRAPRRGFRPLYDRTTKLFSLSRFGTLEVQGERFKLDVEHGWHLEGENAVEASRRATGYREKETLETFSGLIVRRSEVSSDYNIMWNLIRL